MIINKNKFISRAREMKIDRPARRNSVVVRYVFRGRVQ